MGATRAVERPRAKPQARAYIRRGAASDFVAPVDVRHLRSHGQLQELDVQAGSVLPENLHKQIAQFRAVG
jgi:hypothetical protein